MNTRQLLGFVALSIGVLLLIFAIRGYVPETLSTSERITNSPLSPTERFPETIATDEPGGCIQVCLAMGMVLVLAGVMTAIRYRK